MSCPYAAPLAKDEISSVTSSPTGGPLVSDDPEVKEALELAKSACPAFQDGKGCPFRDATDAEKIRLAMLKVPPSHIGMGDPAVVGGGNNDAGNASPGDTSDVSSKFRKALEHIHTVSTNLHTSNPVDANSSNLRGGNAESPLGGFTLQGGCPFKTFYKSKGGSGNSVPFVSAMEGLSLSAIIARMADNDKDMSISITPKTSVSVTSGAEEAQQQSPPPPQPPQELSISAALQTGTAESHEAAESVHFVKNFVKGIIDRDLYASLVVSLYHVYNVMEEELNKHGPTHFPELHHPRELARTESLDDDAEFFHGMDWEKSAVGSQSPATAEYVERLRYIAKTEPLLLLSHAYTRYLGDLSGGRILARVARRALNLKGSKDGLRFYEFELIENAKKFKDAYRKALDDLKLSTDQVDRLVAEANVAFVLNMRVFEELDVKGGVQGARVRPLSEATKYYDQCLSEQKQGRRGSAGALIDNGEAKCPFAYLGGPNPHASDSPVKAEKSEADATPLRSEEDASIAHEKGDRCPWPFVFFHDPKTGMRDWQSWVVIGLVFSWMWSKMQT